MIEWRTFFKGSYDDISILKVLMVIHILPYLDVMLRRNEFFLNKQFDEKCKHTE